VEGFEKLSWNEDIVVVMAALGFLFAVRGKKYEGLSRPFITFIATYTFTLTIIYCVIPYKTPWSMLSFLHGMVLLASIGTVVLIKAAMVRWEKVLVWGMLILFGLVSPGMQSYLQNFHYYADTSNPYVYAHTSKDIFKIVNRIDEISMAHPDGRDMYIQVICPEGDCWPLPWYLRNFKKAGYWNEVDDTVASAELIIAKPEIETSLLRKLYSLPPAGQKRLYVPLFDSYTELRPGVELRGYITKDLWDRFQQLGVD
jgi:predicted membrane-bound mannosyltransferase